MKKLVYIMSFVIAIMTSFTLVSCGDDNNNTEDNAVAGTYVGEDNLAFSYGKQDFSDKVEGAKYVVTVNKDGSLNVVFPEESFDFTSVMQELGTIVQGSYVVKDIPFDKTKNAYYLDYAGSVAADVTIFGKKNNYELTVGEVTVTVDGNNLKVVNRHQFGKMPFVMTNTYNGVK